MLKGIPLFRQLNNVKRRSNIIKSFLLGSGGLVGRVSDSGLVGPGLIPELAKDPSCILMMAGAH